MKDKVLIIAAHPDDEILGCGGAAARLVKEGHEVYTLILGEGVTSRDEKRDRAKRKKDIDKLRSEMAAANKLIGITKVFTHKFPDNRFDTVPFLDIVKIVEKVKDGLKPDIIFTHFFNDLNIDHRITYKAAITAARPFSHETVREIYSFQSLSSTEWNYPADFSPDIFFDINSTLKLKLEAMKVYKSELRKYPHPRSLKAIEINAAYWGTHVGLIHADAFKSVRVTR